MLINACNLKSKLGIYSLSSYLTEKCSFIKLELLVDLTEFVRVVAAKSCGTRFKHQHDHKKVLCCLKQEVGIGTQIQFPSVPKAREPKWYPSPTVLSAPPHCCALNEQLTAGWALLSGPGWTVHEWAVSAASAVCCPKERQWQTAPGKLLHTCHWLSNRRRSSLTPAMFLQGLQSRCCSLVIICQDTRQPAPFKHRKEVKQDSLVSGWVCWPSSYQKGLEETHVLLRSKIVSSGAYFILMCISFSLALRISDSIKF